MALQSTSETDYPYISTGYKINACDSGYFLAWDDEDGLRQVLVNLLLNAIDASPEAALVLIETGSINGCVLLDVSDQGCGIDEQHVGEIFSPMFSTKRKGEGTGLGLSISRDLIRQMGGDLLLFVNSPNGCTFRVTLPEATGEG